MASSDFDGMSVDAEGATDTESHSKLAFAAIIVLLVGCLAPIEPRLALISGTATAMALLMFLFATRFNYSNLSKRLAGCVLLVGTVLTVWSGTAWYIETSTRNRTAIEIATQYIDALANNRMFDAIQMVGLPPAVRDLETEQISREQESVRRYLQDSTLKKIQSMGTAAKWKSVGIVNSNRDHNVYTFIVRFIDETQKSPTPYDVEIKFEPPTKYSDPIDRWLVDHVEVGNT